jgi:hypothetical protein
LAAAVEGEHVVDLREREEGNKGGSEQRDVKIKVVKVTKEGNRTR